jgi:hypothetical protein
MGDRNEKLVEYVERFPAGPRMPLFRSAEINRAGGPFAFQSNTSTILGHDDVLQLSVGPELRPIAFQMIQSQDDAALGPASRLDIQRSSRGSERAVALGATLAQIEDVPEHPRRHVMSRRKGRRRRRGSTAAASQHRSFIRFESPRLTGLVRLAGDKAGPRVT